MEAGRTLALLFALCPLLALAGESSFSAVAASAKSASKPSDHGAISFGNIWDEHNPGYSVQTGYEGYLIPADSLSVKDIIKTAGFVAALPILGKLALKLVVKVALAALGLAAVVSVGVVLTWLLCTCTSVCKLTLHKFDKWHSWDRESVRGFLSTDRIDSAANFLTSAIAKYGQLEQKSSAPNKN